MGKFSSIVMHFFLNVSRYDDRYFKCMIMGCITYTSCKGILYLANGGEEPGILVHQTNDESKVIQITAYNHLNAWNKGKYCHDSPVYYRPQSSEIMSVHLSECPFDGLSIYALLTEPFISGIYSDY